MPTALSTLLGLALICRVNGAPEEPDDPELPVVALDEEPVVTLDELCDALELDPGPWVLEGPADEELLDDEARLELPVVEVDVPELDVPLTEPVDEAELDGPVPLLRLDELDEVAAVAVVERLEEALAAADELDELEVEVPVLPLHAANISAPIQARPLRAPAPPVTLRNRLMRAPPTRLAMSGSSQA